MRSLPVACLLCLGLLSSFCFAQPASSLKADAADSLRRFNEARALQEKGFFREAQKLYESVLPALEAGRNYADRGSALNALSQIGSALGAYDTAIARARESAEVYRKLGDKTGEARAVNNIGVAELYRGDYAAGMGYFQQALALSRSSDDREGEIEQLNNIGNVFYFQAKYLDALRAYQDAMDHVERAAGEAWYARRRQITVFNLGTLYQRLGREDRALELYQQLQKFKQGLSSSEEARLLTNLGALYRRLGDPRKALDTYRAAQRMFAREQHADGQLGVLKNIGILLALDLDNLPGALETFTSAVALAERAHNRREAMQAHLYRGESLYRLDQLDRAKQEFETALVAAKELGTTEEQWKALYGLGRTAERGGNDDLATSYFRRAIASIEAIRSRLQLSSLKSEFFADKRDVYDALIGLLLHQPDTAELFNIMERSRARMFQDRLQESAPGSSPKPPSTATLEAVQHRLDDSTVLLEFWVSAQTIAVAWVTHNRSGISWKRFAVSDLSEISAFVGELQTDSREEWRNHSELLGKLLLSGVEPLADPKVRHVLIVPDGMLTSLPFELLGTGAGAGSLLVERFDISYLPSAAILLRGTPTRSGSWGFPWRRQLVAFGDPVVSSQTSRSLSEALPGEEMRRWLPRFAGEVQAIASLTGGRAELYLGAADLKKYLIQGRAKGVPLLHLSTHATADADNPERSRILFSSANENEAADYLFLKEIYDIDLRGVDLSTLSACDTERGKMIRGEGVQGFSRALLSAGSRAAVTTLWRVADQPTSDFMKQFYYALSQGKPKAEALRWAKLKFLRSGTALRHPRYWGAFVLNGDGLHPMPRALPWGTSLLTIAGALFVLVLMTRRFLWSRIFQAVPPMNR